jgi:hypothetical protein
MKAWRRSCQGDEGEEPIEDYCQHCGRMIDWDMVGFDDVCSGPYVTDSGDLFCIPCGRRVQQEEEELVELGEGPYGEPLLYPESYAKELKPKSEGDKVE